MKVNMISILVILPFDWQFLKGFLVGGILCSLVFYFNVRRRLLSCKSQVYRTGTGKIITKDQFWLGSDSDAIRFALDKKGIPYKFARVIKTEQTAQEGESRNYRYTIEYWQE